MGSVRLPGGDSRSGDCGRRSTGCGTSRIGWCTSVWRVVTASVATAAATPSTAAAGPSGGDTWSAGWCHPVYRLRHTVYRVLTVGPSGGDARNSARSGHSGAAGADPRAGAGALQAGVGPVDARGGVVLGSVTVVSHPATLNPAAVCVAVFAPYAARRAAVRRRGRPGRRRKRSPRQRLPVDCGDPGPGSSMDSQGLQEHLPWRHILSN